MTGRPPTHPAPPPGAVGVEQLLGVEWGGWRELALCRQVDPDLFYPARGGSAAAAKRVCASCPVRVQCLAAAVAGGERHGVWGGLSPGERARLAERADRPGRGRRWVA